MIDREEQGLLETNPFFADYGTNVKVNTTIQLQQSSANIQPKHSKTSFGFYFLLKIVYGITNILIIVGFLFVIGFEKFQHDFFTATLISVTICCLLSCYGLIKFGTTQGQISQMKITNYNYKSQNKTLKNTKNVLNKEITQLEMDTQTLTQQISELKQSEKKYSHIITQLETMTENKEDIMEAVDYSNKTLERMRDLINRNQRAYLLAKFYQCLPKGPPEYVIKTTVMNARQYELFLQKITKQWRNKFIKMGSDIKEIWKCEKVNVKQFLQKVNEITGTASDLNSMEFDKAFKSVSIEMKEEYYDEKTFVPTTPWGKGRDTQPDIIKKIHAKSTELEASFDELSYDEAVNIPFVDIIDDQHNNQILHWMKKSRGKKQRPLNRQDSVHLSQCDLSVDTLRKELNIQKGNVPVFGDIGSLKSPDNEDNIYLGVYGKRAD